MANCLNCKKKLGCSCKRRTASNGTSCCVSCIGVIEKTSTTTSTTTAPGVILNVTAVEKE